MSVYQLRTYADLVAAVREELQIQASDTTAINRIKRDLNIVYEEVAGEKDWWFLHGHTTLQMPAYVGTGTAAVTQGSNSVTLSITVSSSKTGYFFAIDGYSEIYKIEAHAAGSATLKLETEFTGTTNSAATYRIWTDRIPLPVDCAETKKVWHDHFRSPLESLGLTEFRDVASSSPRAEGKPQYYSTGDFIDPAQTSAITSLPATASRLSSGVRKTIVFASSLPTAVVTKVSNGDPVRWRITGAGHYSYNGDILISAISTTNSTNDTITYTARHELQESLTADTSMSITQLDQEAAYDRYRELYLHPAQSSSRVSLHVDYVRAVLPMENDSDEPAIPKEFRSVLLYGALHRAWSRMRNPEEAARNFQLFQAKLARMASKLQDSTEKPVLAPSSLYLNAKRNASRSRTRNYGGPLTAGGGSGGSSVVGTPSTAAIFDSSGNLTSSSTISTTELGYLDGASSNIQDQIDAHTTSLAAKALASDLTAHLNDSADAHDASAISVSASGNLSSTDVQSALDELQTDVDTRALDSDLDAHIADTTDVHAASAITNTPSGNLAATTVQAALNELQIDIDSRALSSDLTAHIGDTSDAHDASAISVSAITGMTATDVQAALAELQSDIDGISGGTGLSDHLNDTTDAHDASAISVVASGNLAATDAQGALDELQGDIDGLNDKFDTSTGHDHDGTDSKKILGTNINSDSAGAFTYLKADGSGGSSFSAILQNVVSKSAAYTATSADNIILCDASGGAFTITLPAAASNTGKKLKIKKTDSTFTQVTIDGNASETIDGATTKKLSTQYEEYEIVSDGSNWHVIGHTIPSSWTSFTMVVTGVTSNPTKASSPTKDAAFWRRRGDSIDIMWTYVGGSTGAAAGSGHYLYAIPSGLTIDTTKVTANTNGYDAQTVGTAVAGLSDTVPSRVGISKVYDSTRLILSLSAPLSDYMNFVGSGVFNFNGASKVMQSFSATVPISGWEG